MISSRSNVHAHFSEKETGSKPFAHPEGAVRRELRESNMNNKAIAVLAVVVMAISGCAVAMSEQSEAADTNLGTVYIDEEKTTAEVELRFNELAYTTYDSYAFNIIAYDINNYRDAKSVYSDNIVSSTSSSERKVAQDIVVDGSTGALNVAVEKSKVGIYKVSVKNSTANEDNGINGAQSGTYTIGLSLNVVPIKDGATVDLEPIDYRLVVNVRSFTPIDFSTEGTLTAGVGGSIILSTTQIDVTDYSWYATGLKPGLNIGIVEDNLAIHGMTATSEESITMEKVVIVGRDVNGNEVRDTFENITIKATPKITYTITVDGKKLDPVNGNVYMFETGDGTPKLTIEYGEDARAIAVSVIDTTNDTRTPVKYTNAGVDLPINGVGRYVVEMTVYFEANSDIINTTGLTTIATIEVVPNITGAGAGFIVVGGN